jgi:hypothetical protein
MNNLSHHPVDDMIQFLGTGWKLVPSRSEVDIHQEQFLFIKTSSKTSHENTPTNNAHAPCSFNLFNLMLNLIFNNNTPTSNIGNRFEDLFPDYNYHVYYVKREGVYVMVGRKMRS